MSMELGLVVDHDETVGSEVGALLAATIKDQAPHRRRVERLVRTDQAGMFQVVGDHLLHRLDLSHGADVIDCIEGVGCELELTIAGRVVPLDTSVLVAGLKFTRIVLTARIPRNDRPGVFGFRARMTVLPQKQHDEIRDGCVEHDGYVYVDGLFGTAAPAGRATTRLMCLPVEHDRVVDAWPIRSHSCDGQPHHVHHVTIHQMFEAKGPGPHRIPLDPDRTVDVCDRLEAVGCTLSLEIGDTMVKLTRDTVVPLLALKFQLVNLVAHASDGQFGFKARCTMLPADRLRELDKALAFDTLECGGHLYKGGVCVGPLV